MAVHRLKHSFTSGEVTPFVYMRADLEKYVTGAKQIRNFVLKPQGPLVRRPGSKFIHDFGTYNGKRSIIIPFIFNTTQSYCLVFIFNGSQYIMYVAMDDGLVETSPGSGTPYTLAIPSSYDMEEVFYAQSNDVLFIVQEDQPPAKIQRTDINNWSFAQISFTNAPSQWKTNNYPGVIGFLEQRCVYAATPSEPETLWLSKAGNFSDFGTSSPIQDDDAIIFTLNSGQQNRIQWLATSRNLLIGTIGSEWSFGGSGFSPATPTNVRANRYTHEGGIRVVPIGIGAAVLFIDFFGKKVFELVYDYMSDSYRAGDLTIVAPHLTYSRKIISWDWQKRPNSVVWCVTDDGILLALTYQRIQKVMGWTVHELGGNGFVLDVGCIPGNQTGETETWLVVKRQINGEERIYLERIVTEFISDDVRDATFLDSFKYYEGSPGKVFSGLDYLAGETISVLADGLVHPDVVVSLSGEITLEREASVVCVGYSYRSLVRPLFPDIVTQSGTSFGRVQRITNVDVMLYNSIGFKIGRTLDALEIVPFRTPQTPPTDPMELFTGAVHYPFPEGYKRESDLYIVQDDPLPITIEGLIDTVEVYE